MTAVDAVEEVDDTILENLHTASDMGPEIPTAVPSRV